jgi:cytochrome c oxidase assembly protein subunit 15
MQITPERYRQIAVASLVALFVVIVAGAAVRLTNSGLGCDDWPNCNETTLVDVSSKHAAIEQVNRLFTGVVGFAVIAAVLGAYKRVPFRRDLSMIAWWLVFGVLANAVIGGISVKVDLHPMWVQSHMLLSMFLVAMATLLVRRAGEPDGVVRVRQVDATTERIVWAHFALSCLAIFTGTIVTGSGPHAGDEVAERLAIDIPDAARIHGVTVVVTIVLGLFLALRSMRDQQLKTALQQALSVWMVAGVIQAAIGYIQYFNGVPALLVGIHVLGATIVMWASTVVLLATRRAPAAVPESLSAELVRT